MTVHVHYNCELYAWHASMVNMSYFLICDCILQLLILLWLYGNDFICMAVFVSSAESEDCQWDRQLPNILVSTCRNYFSHVC